MSKKVTVAALSFLAFVALIFAIGLVLPERRAFVKTASFNKSPEQVFQIVTDVANQASWRTDVQEVRVLDQYTWTEVPKKGTPITFKIKQKVQNKIFEIEIVEPKSFNGNWIGIFEPTATGTKVVFKEVVTIDNPFFRVMSFVFVDLDKTMETYMTNLKNKLGA